MKQFLKYFLVASICFFVAKGIWAADNISSFSENTRQKLTNQYLKCFSAEDQKLMLL